MAATTSAPPKWRSTRTATSSALRISTLANMGAYLSTFAPCVPTYLYATLLAGVYKTPVIYCEVKAVFTNTVPVDAYRGAGRPEATFLLERLVDVDRARHRHRPRRAAAAEFHSRRCVPVPDAGGAAIRQRRLPGDAGRRAEGRRLRRLRSAPHRGQSARQAARHRHLHLSRGLRHRALGRGRLARRPRRALRGAPTSACIRPAASRCSPARTATARATKPPSRSLSSAQLGVPIDQVEVVHGDTGEDPVRHGHLRQPQPRGRRLGDGQGDGQGHRQGQEDRRPPDGSLGRRHRVRGRQIHRRRHRQVEDAGGDLARRLRAAQLSDRGTGAGPRRNRVLRSEELHLPGRLPRLRGRDRSGHRRRRRW